MTSTLTNNQRGATLMLNGISITGTNAAEFTLLSGNQQPGVTNCITGGANPAYQALASLPPGQSCTVYAQVTPGAPGKRSARVVFSDNANNSPQTVYMTVTGQ
jgi:hypothetical protein